MISRELELTFNMAVREAESRQHELVTLEHLLLAMCFDKLARVGFMDPAAVRKFIDELEDLGLTYLSDDKAVDLLVCDQLRGPLADCDWVQFTRVDFEDGKVGMAWWWHRPVRFGVAMPAAGVELHTPPGWQFKDSLSDKFTFLPEGQTSSREDH